MLAGPLDALLLIACGCILTSPCSAFDVFFGSAPFCRSSPDSCHQFGLEHIGDDPRGTGSKCFTGSKAHCQPRALKIPLQESPRSDLVVAAYNLWESSYVVIHRGQTERTCHAPRILLNQVPDVDVIVFNEIFIGGCLQGNLADRKVSLGDLFNFYGYPHSTTVSGEGSRSMFNSNGGVLIVSKWPIIESKEYVFKSYAGLDRFSERGATYIKVSKQAINYNIIGTQLQSGNHDNTRLKQAEELHEFITDLKLPIKEAVIIAGDFHTDRLGYPDKIDHLLKAMHAGMPTVIGTVAATIDYSLNELVDSKHTVKEWTDYVVYETNHKQPDSSTMEAIMLKSDTDISFCSSAPLQAYYAWPNSIGCRSVSTTKDLSNHFPVVARFTYNHQELNVTTSLVVEEHVDDIIK